MREAMDGLKLQAGQDGISGSVTLSGINAETFRFYEGTAWNSRVCEYACVPMKNGEILLIETDWFLEAEEGIGRRLMEMRDTLSLSAQDMPLMVQCEICGGWYEEGNIFRNHVCPAKEPASELVATASVNLRTGAGLSYHVVTCVSKGTRLAFMNETRTDERGAVWYRVLHKQKDVWVSSKYAKPTENHEIPIVDNNVYVVTTASVNLRKGPGLDYNVIASVSASSKLMYIARETDDRGTVWYEVAYNNGTAWVSSKYARIPC
ncbi:MAG: SH3 domain-containing protein [Methanocorpusculum sp.]|nr:SH3 domain-containing protein [Methanocorpusculum sp.]